MPLNLSVKDPCNALPPRPPFHRPPRGADPAAAAAPSPDAPRAEDGPEQAQTDPSSPDAAAAQPPTAPPARAQEPAAVDSSDEQKQTAAVALCQLAAYSPGTVRVGDGEPTAPESTCQQDAPTVRATENQEAQCDPRPRAQKRTSPRDAGKSQQGTKKTKPSDTARVFTLRKRTRVS